MKRALVIGASGGIGRALYQSLTERGVKTTALSRSADGLDITSEQSVAAAFAQLTGPFDLIFTATGALEIGAARPEKALKQITETTLANQFALNAIGPALVLKYALPLLPRDRRAVFAALSARVGSIGDNHLGGWYGYRAAKSALNQIIHTAAIEIARTHNQAICVAMHPGTVATPLTSRYVKTETATPPAEAANNLLTVLNNLTPANSGGFFDYAGRPVPW